MLSLFVFDARIPAYVCARAMRGDHHGRLQGIDVTNLHIAAAASIVDAHMPVVDTPYADGWLARYTSG